MVLCLLLCLDFIYHRVEYDVNAVVSGQGKGWLPTATGEYLFLFLKCRRPRPDSSYVLHVHFVVLVSISRSISRSS